jgi:hypothetical protein
MQGIKELLNGKSIENGRQQQIKNLLFEPRVV